MQWKLGSDLGFKVCWVSVALCEADRTAGFLVMSIVCASIPLRMVAQACSDPLQEGITTTAGLPS